ncbi:c-type cytochrome biogenesis protein CcmI [Bradyrhizobium sp.]|uniref:c-type cytochrome biogenesis protein CcmI n=1 Tax=Bradyrhizobium sp. TaxID=376 RepID=UPI001E0CDDF5|nr:c-type cytochrome biogenesis protein CcmI [Bradyrhizobium sp.]MBI5319479.1 c-type cytochrome biogenesis protein CcmI [Bradyrhizobium sp.]
MMLWLVFTSMIAVAAVLVATPFIRRFERVRLESAGNLAVYRDQLRQVESDVALGVIDPAQAEAAGLEIKRKILAVGRADEPGRSPLSQAERKFALTVVTSIVIFGSILLYAIVGSPELPSTLPAQVRLEQPPAPRRSAEAAAQPQGSTAVEALASRAAAQPQAGLASVDEMIQRVEARLQRSAQDADGWRMLGWAYFSIERFTDAANAYSRAVELRPDSAEYRSARGEALVRGADGTVTAPARKDFDEAVKLDPKDARARFFIGLAKEQAGDRQAALADWSKLLAESDAAEPWLPDLRERVAELQRELAGANTGSLPTRPDLSADALREFLQSEKSKQRAAEAPRREPGPEDVRNAGNMAPQDRAAMIRGMVEGLASRLEQQPRDAEGWIKLVRSRVVLGEAELADKSLRRALSVFSEDGPERTQIVDAARQLGLKP